MLSTSFKYTFLLTPALLLLSLKIFIFVYFHFGYKTKKLIAIILDDNI